MYIYAQSSRIATEENMIANTAQKSHYPPGNHHAIHL